MRNVGGATTFTPDDLDDLARDAAGVVAARFGDLAAALALREGDPHSPLVRAIGAKGDHDVPTGVSTTERR